MNSEDSKMTGAINPIALRKAKTVYNFGLSESNSVIRNDCQNVPVFMAVLVVLE